MIQTDYVKVNREPFWVCGRNVSCARTAQRRAAEVGADAVWAPVGVAAWRVVEATAR